MPDCPPGCRHSRLAGALSTESLAARRVELLRPCFPCTKDSKGKKPKTASPHSTKAATRRNERHSRRAADPQAFGRWRMPSGNVSRGEPRCTFVNEIVGLRLAMSVFPKVYDFAGDAVLSLVEPGLYKKGWHNDDSIA
jgi:hypothetical protein